MKSKIIKIFFTIVVVTTILFATVSRSIESDALQNKTITSLSFFENTCKGAKLGFQLGGTVVTISTLLLYQYRPDILINIIKELWEDVVDQAHEELALVTNNDQILILIVNFIAFGLVSFGFLTYLVLVPMVLGGAIGFIVDITSFVYYWQ
ncbi:MAG: hypothetical protein ACR2PT_04975 [Endozoicomonas sp.]